jgi:hypothetical protein
MPAVQRIPVFVALALFSSSAPTMGSVSENEQPTNANSERYVLPDGGPTELVEFIRRLSQHQPTTTEEDLERRSKLQAALKRAAEKIVALENDQTSTAYEVAQFILLVGRVRSLAQAVRKEQEDTLADVRAYVIESAAKGEGKAAAQLAETAGKTCQATGQYDLAAKTYATLGEVLEKSQDASVATSGRKMRVQGERLLALSKGVPKVSDAPEVPAGSKLVPLDIQMLGNDSVVGSIGSGQFSGNGLAELQKGEQTLGGVRFHIGDKLIRMADVEDRDGVLKVEGIPVQQKITRLFTLHATGNGSPYFADGTKIGSYTIRYEDGSEESIPIVYGEDVRDWWDFDEGKPVTRGRVVWTGGNLAADKYEVTIRLYLGAWKNPHPDKMVTAIDYVSSTSTKCRPFCVAITVEVPHTEP